jgi:hypothetical protein
VRQDDAWVVASLENRCRGEDRLRRKFAGRIGGRGEDDRYPPQARGKERVGLVIFASQPVRFRQQKVDSDNARGRRYFHQPGELVPRPGPLSDLVNRLAVDVDHDDPVRRPRARPVPFVSVEYRVAKCRQQAVRRRVGDEDDHQTEQRRDDSCSCRAAPQGRGGQTGTGYAHRACRSEGTESQRPHQP